MRSLLKPSMRRTDFTVRVFLITGSLIALWTGCSTGCSKSEMTNAGETGVVAMGSAQSASGASMIDSIPFGELNGIEEYNASDVIPFGDSRFLFCDNNTNDALFELRLAPDGLKKGPLIRRPLQGLAPGAASDLEDMALVEEGGRRYIFITSSMRFKKAKDGSLGAAPSGAVRVTINPDETLSAENMPDFREWLIRAYPQLATLARTKPNDGGLNIEGLAWDGNRRALLFGLRTPMPDGKPMVMPVRLKDLGGPWATSNLEALPPIHLSVEPAADEQGIRCIDDGPSAAGFLVITGKATNDSRAPYSLYEWSGDANGAMRRFNVVFAKKMKPEGITRGTIGGRKALVIVDDGGGYKVIWDDGGVFADSSRGN
jgi:hypothetical protein